MRNSIKFFDLSFNEFSSLLYTAFTKSDKHFFNTRTIMSVIKNLYYNVGVDVRDGKYCGNTILCSIYAPYYSFDANYGKYLRDISVIAGKLTAHYGGTLQAPYSVNLQTRFTYSDFHFFSKCPLKDDKFSNFVLFSVLCSINYVRYFINEYFTDEFSSKLRFSYLLYYYLVSFMIEVNNKLSTDFKIDNKYSNSNFRNCMAHYGLGQEMKEADIIESDTMMFGLTDKIFLIPYSELKGEIFSELAKLANQLEAYLF